MKESKVSKQLVLHWVPVVDAQGRTHMEAVWTTGPVVHTAHAA
ncbi:MAG: hypothetical protein ACXVD1_03475 [Nocardioides sp.]